MSSNDMREPIAIIGIGCRFPGARNPKEFWKILREGIDAVCEVPRDRWDMNALFDPDPASPGKINSRWGGFIDKVDQFDWRTFRIPPREAKYMDPQHRLLLEVAWEALEDAGLPLEKVAGSRTGVFIGIMWNDYLRMQAANFSLLNGYSNTGNAVAFAPNRISYVFDLKGPSVAVDSACASSLTSVHYACQSLWLGEAGMALAGGVNLMLSPDIFIMLSKTGVLSPEGRCKTLDAKADGFVRGEGAGIVVLKPFSRLTPSDRVYAVIRGSAINHNGHNEWIMAANPEAQELVIRDAYSRSGINPAEIDYVELNGTGLLKGDALEAKVLGKVVGTHNARNHPCSIGSVKTNIGHLESAAGIAGIIKVALSLYNRQIPPTLHFQEINPDIALESLGLSVQKKLGSWPDRPGPNLAGVTAVAMSGVNAHVVLEGPPQNFCEYTRAEQPGAAQAQFLPLSARSPEALSALVRAFKDFLTDEEAGARLSLENICYTAGVRRSHHEYRVALVSRSRQAFIKNIEAFLQGQLPAGVFAGRTTAGDQEMLDSLGQEGVRTDLISECLGQRNQDGNVFVSLPTDGKKRSEMLEALATLYAHGYMLDWSALYPGGAQCVQLPTYPWQRERLWLDWIDNHKSLYCLEQTIKSEKQGIGEPNELLRKIEEAQPIHGRSILLKFLRNQVLKILGLDPSYPLKPQDRLFETGLDSIGAVDLMNILQNSLGRSLPSTLIFDYPTIEALSDYLARKVLSIDLAVTSKPRSEKDADAWKTAIPTNFDHLSENDAEALLIKKLQAIEKDMK